MQFAFTFAFVIAFARFQAKYTTILFNCHLTINSFNLVDTEIIVLNRRE